jgi:DnaJ-class molecular chaperone
VQKTSVIQFIYQLAKQHHPDAGGDAQKFIQINKAYTCIEDWIKSQA